MSYIIIKHSNNIGDTIDQELDGEYEVVGFYGTNSFYNVNENNNKVYINENGTPYTVSLNYGNYSASDLTSELETQLNNFVGSNIYNVSYSTTTGKFTITGGTYNFWFEFGTFSLNSANKLIGFNATNTPASLTQTSDNVIQLASLPIVYASIKEDVYNSISGKNHFFASFMIYDSSTFGGGTLRMLELDKPVKIHIRRTKRINVSFHNEEGEVINNNGTDWTLILRNS